MKNLTLILKSFRLLNVFSMLFLLIGLRFYFWKHIAIQENYSFVRSNADFLLLLLIVGLISAAGYLVNDIFDVKVDKVNKPEKELAYSNPILWAIYLGMNSIAIIVSFILAENGLTQFILLGTIILLFLYSLLFQKLPLIGNLTVSLLASILPVLYLSFDVEIKIHAYNHPSILFINIILFYSLLGFGITFLREVVKDIEDIKGDERSNYKTFPVLVGIKGSQVLFYLLAGLFTLVLFYFDEGLSYFLFDNIYYYLPIFVFLVLAVYQVSIANFLKASLFLKLTLFSGVLILFIL